ncbi:MAG: DUF3810 domain-containing protein [Oscillospiraceae bacterium]|nr:DUF3810 domain-containing protein [Oscillospiraceae bacterium]
MKNRSFLSRYATMAMVPLAFAALYWLFSRSQEMAEKAVELFSRPARDFLGTLSSVAPFSIAEVLCAAGILYVAIFIIRTVVQIFSGKFVEILKRAMILVLVCAYLGAGYLCLWGIDYRTRTFREREALGGGISAEELYNAAAFFVDRANSLADSVERDESGSFTGKADELLGCAAGIYGAVQARFPSLAGTPRVPKAMMFSAFMSATGFTGIYFPYTGESNVNVAQPAIFVPMTAAHELAHQLGVTDEDACNAIGVSACVTSDDAAYRYSGYLNGSIYLLNALYRADKDGYNELRARVTGSMTRDFEENNAYWNSVRSSKPAQIATETMEQVYDAYLKANGVESGFKSYGECVDIIVKLWSEGFYK